jgi:hypothetical protein
VTSVVILVNDEYLKIKRTPNPRKNLGFMMKPKKLKN